MRRLPTAVSDYKEMIEGGYSYIDKTFFIEELLQSKAKTILIVRPSRFGKTLNMSMLKYFFEKTKTGASHLFSGLAIEKTSRMKLQGTFPVIFLSFKENRKATFEKSLSKLQSLIQDEYKKHEYLLFSLDEEEKVPFEEALNGSASPETSIKLLMDCLARYHGKKVIVLIDGIDFLLRDAYLFGDYEKMLNLIHPLLTSVLKESPYLEKAVVTGFLPTYDRSLFEKIDTLLEKDPVFSFGFFEREVESLLDIYGISCKMPELYKYYGGYETGEKSLYNPASILHCIGRKGAVKASVPLSNEGFLIGKLLIGKNPLSEKKLQRLLSEKSIEASLSEEMSLLDLETKEDAFTGLLFFGGYLGSKDGSVSDLKIPNRETRDLFGSIAKHFFTSNLSVRDVEILIHSLLKDDPETLSKMLKLLFTNGKSSVDFFETTYPILYKLLALALSAELEKTHEVLRSYKEEVYEIRIIPKNPTERGIVLFCKTSDNEISLKEGTKKAIRQELSARGIRKVLFLTVFAEGKKVQVLRSD